MNKEFNNWWNSDELLKDNPYRPDSPAYWAWEGWCAGVAAEREACAKLCDEIDDGRKALSAECAEAIRARGQA